MRIGILSDIHGNYEALTAVLNTMKECGVEELIISGDLIGYYYRIDLVLECLEDWKWISCMGNHELMYLKWQNGTLEDRSTIKKKYGSSFQQADYLLTEKQNILLNDLSHPVKYEINGFRFLICHGSPENINQYLYPDNNIIFEVFEKYVSEVDIIVLGHTHFPAQWQMGSLNIINPGSVGQPRSGVFNGNRSGKKARAEWVLFDSDTMIFDFRTSIYDASNVINQVEKFDPKLVFLKNVFLRGLD